MIRAMRPFFIFLILLVSPGTSSANDARTGAAQYYRASFLSDSAIEMSWLHPSEADALDDQFRLLLDTGIELQPEHLDYSQAVAAYTQIDDPWIKSRWVAQFSPNVLKGQFVKLIWKTELSEPPFDQTLEFDEQIVTGSIQLNQVGYLPDNPKVAWIGNWSGARSYR